jgi:hypothetical protein
MTGIHKAKRSAAVRELAADPTASDTVLAHRAGVSEITIYRARKRYGYDAKGRRSSKYSIATDGLLWRIITILDRQDLSVLDAQKLCPDLDPRSVQNAVYHLARLGIIRPNGRRRINTRGRPSVVYGLNIDIDREANQEHTPNRARTAGAV